MLKRIDNFVDAEMKNKLVLHILVLSKFTNL